MENYQKIDEICCLIGAFLFLIYLILFFKLDIFLKLITSFVFSFLIGLERKVHGKPAGPRTHILVGVGTTIFTILSYQYFGKMFGSDPSRIASYILAGIGFIGAGAIIKEEQKVVGLTTASSLWITASIGMAIGVGAYDIAVLALSLGLISLSLRYLVAKH